MVAVAVAISYGQSIGRIYRCCVVKVRVAGSAVALLDGAIVGVSMVLVVAMSVRVTMTMTMTVTVAV